MVMFAVSCEISIGFFYFAPRSWQDEKHLSLFLYPAQNLPSLLIIFTNMTLSTLLILTVCRTRVTICIRPRSPNSLYGSVVEHRNANSKGLRFDSSWELRICSLSHAREKHQFQSDFHSDWQLDDLQSHRRLLWDQWHCGTLHAQQVTQLLMQS